MSKMKNLLIVPAAVLTLSVGSLAAHTTVSSASVKKDVAVKQVMKKSVSETAKSLAGTPYRKGGNTPKGFDASGFTQYVLKHSNANKNIPRKITDQWNKGKHVKKSDLKAGDLVFFKEYGKTPNLVGIYIGKNQFVATTVKGTKVYSMSQKYWKNVFAGGVRY
jgi:cell wall-associated NlpC family hydrolase